MKLRLLAFGIAGDILKARRMDYVLQSGDTVAALRESLGAEYWDLAQLDALRFAVNEIYVHDDHRLQEGDEVVLIPPVSGG